MTNYITIKLNSVQMSRNTLRNKTLHLPVLMASIICFFASICIYTPSLEAASDQSSRKKETTKKSLKNEVVSQYKQQHGDLRDRFSFGAGLLGGMRSMEQSDTGVTHSTALLGASLTAEGLFSLSKGDTVGLGGRFGFDYAPFKTNAPNSNEQLNSNYKKLTAHLHYVSGVSSFIVLKMLLGVEWTDMYVEPNSNYEGDFYIPMVFGGGAEIRPSPDLQLNLEAQIKPIITAKNIPGFVEGQLRSGLGGRTKLTSLHFLPLQLSLEYEVQYYDSAVKLGGKNLPNFPKQTDLIHTGQLRIGVSW